MRSLVVKLVIYLSISFSLLTCVDPTESTIDPVIFEFPFGVASVGNVTGADAPEGAWADTWLTCVMARQANAMTLKIVGWNVFTVLIVF